MGVKCSHIRTACVFVLMGWCGKLQILAEIILKYKIKTKIFGLGTDGGYLHGCVDVAPSQNRMRSFSWPTEQDLVCSNESLPSKHVFV